MVRDDKTMMFKHGKQNNSQFNEKKKETKFKFKHKQLFSDLWKAGDTGRGEILSLYKSFDKDLTKK